MKVRARIRWSLVSVTAVLAAGAGVTPASGATGRYVALGDSYSAGAGSGSYIADGTPCYRSSRAYPVLVGLARGLDVTQQSCSGARTSDIAGQAQALTSNTSLVTVTIGGNDIGFADIITACAKPGWMADCAGEIRRAEGKVNTELPGGLRASFAQIRAKAPSARVEVTGYPHLFNGRDCSLLTFFSADEMDQLNRGTDQLNAAIRAQAVAAGFRYADPVPPFRGHAVCDSAPYINNLRPQLLVESFHPNANGQRTYADTIGSGAATTRLGVDPAAVVPEASSPPAQDGVPGATVEVQDAADLRDPITVSTGGTTSSDPSRGVVRPPDLRSEQARKAARKAGVDEAELQELVEAQERGVPNDTLERMSQEAVAGGAER